MKTVNLSLWIRVRNLGLGSLVGGVSVLNPAIALESSPQIPVLTLAANGSHSLASVTHPIAIDDPPNGHPPLVFPLELVQAETSPTLPGLQSDPNPDPDNDFGQPTPDVTPIDDANDPPINAVPPTGIGTDSSGNTILGSREPRPDTVLINQFELIDRNEAPLESHYLTPAMIERQIRNLRGRYFSITELQAIADQLTQLYLDGDYITSRAILPEQSIVNDTLRIQVIEGSLSVIEVEGEDRLREDYIRSRIELGSTTPLNTTELENQLRLLRSNPLFKTVEASLRAGEAIGESILVVRVTEANPFTANISADNYAPPSVGSERINLGVGHRNVAGFGDEFLVDYSFTTTDGLDFGNLSYRIPINAMNGAIQFRASPNRNSITQDPFDAFGIRGQSSTYELTYRQPVIRSPREELAFSLGFTFQNSQTFIEDTPTPFGIGPDDEGRSQTRTLSFGQDYVRRDTSGAWAFRSQFRLGTAFFHATENSGDIPDGQFLSWLGQVQRVQRLSDNHLLIAQLYTQFAGEPLLPSQQFVIGGGQSVRGFRQNARSGDSGVRLSIEDRIAIIRNTAGLPVFQLAPFLDLGYVWNDADNPNTESDQRFLAGLGLGILWEPFENFSIHLDYGLPLVDLDDRGGNLQDDGLYFNVGYGF